ncbi:MAG: hypothetical protein M3R27_09480 [Bacteroidota bacterium]|nr:hypothetical protein [Bacteroidota bacterium]
MKLFLAFFLSFFVCATSLLSQNIERKIIIQDKAFYFSTIDEEFQIATLHKGNYSSALSSAKKLAVPAGRNYNDPLNPFSWDIRKGNLYAINFLVHPMNDFNEAIKKMLLSSLKEWNSKITIPDMLLMSADQNMFVYNDPYMFTIRRSNTLNNFYSDAIYFNDTSFLMAITNNDELTIWNYNGKEWKHGNVLAFKAEGFFSLVAKGKSTYLITNAGEVFNVGSDNITVVPELKLNGSLNNGILVEDRDAGSILYLKNSDVDRSAPLSKLIKKKAQKII